MNTPSSQQEITHKELNHESFPIFTLYLIYLEVRGNSIPRKMFWDFDDWLKKHANEVKSAWEFFEAYISEIKDVKTLEKIESDFENILKSKKHSSDWIIERYWKKLLELLDSHIAELESKKSFSETIWAIVVDIELCLDEENPKKVFSRTIQLKNWIFDFDTWEDVFWNYIEFFEKTINEKWLRKTKEINDFIEKLKPENRWNKNVFTNIDDFFETFWFIEFYEYLLRFLKTNSKNKKLINSFSENFPIFDIEVENQSKTQRKFLQLQNEIINN